MNKITPNLPESDYHAQTGSETPLFSYSTAKVLNEKSAYHAWLQHPLLGNQPKESTKAMDDGSILHSLLLGSGPEIVVIQADSYRTNAVKALRDEAKEAGHMPILEKDMEIINAGIDRIKNQIREYAPEFFEPHETELSVRWKMDNGVECQSRFDHIAPETGIIFDLKKAADANPNDIESVIRKFGYDIQEEMYIEAADKTWSDMAGRFKWKFIFFEIKPPYMVSVIDTDGMFSGIGRSKLNRAADKWKTCLDAGTEVENWPGYGCRTVSPAGWAVSREEGE